MSASGEKPRRTLIGLLRRVGREAPPTGHDALEESVLWTAHQRAASAVQDAGEVAQRIAAQLARQRSVADVAAERARSVTGRSPEIDGALARLKETFGRLELVALNAGLEGARFGEGPGRALQLVADEVRAQAGRGTDAVRELATSFAEIGAEVTQVHASFDRVRDLSTELAQDSAALGGATSTAERALGELGEQLTRTTGSDPETARAITEATDAARKLVTALTELRGRTPRALLVAALRPVLEPIFGLLESEREDPPEP